MALIICLVPISAAQGQSATDQVNTSKPNYRAIAAGYAARLQSGDAVTIQQAVSDLRNALQTRGKFGRPVDEVGLSLDPLLDAKQYDAANEFATAMINNMPYSLSRVEEYLSVRAKANLALGNPQLALQLAKSMYNVCEMKDTNQAVNLICDCLLKLNNGGDAGIAAGRKFKLEQIRGATATTQPSQVVATTSTEPADSPDAPFLHSVHVDSAVYDPALIFARHHDKIEWVMGRGNLLLMSDRPAEAEEVFRKAIVQAAKKDDLVAGTEGVARAIRAEDGTVGRANAWIVSFTNNVSQDQTPAK